MTAGGAGPRGRRPVCPGVRVAPGVQPAADRGRLVGVAVTTTVMRPHATTSIAPATASTQTIGGPIREGPRLTDIPTVPWRAYGNSCRTAARAAIMGRAPFSTRARWSG